MLGIGGGAYNITHIFYLGRAVNVGNHHMIGVCSHELFELFRRAIIGQRTAGSEAREEDFPVWIQNISSFGIILPCGPTNGEYYTAINLTPANTIISSTSFAFLSNSLVHIYGSITDSLKESADNTYQPLLFVLGQKNYGSYGLALPWSALSF